MYLQFETKEGFLKWAVENILTTTEVEELLGASKQAVRQSVKNGKLSPLKEVGRVNLYLKEDVLHRKKELNSLLKKYRPYDK